MKLLIHFAVAFFLDGFIRTIFVRAQLTIVDDSPFIRHLYREIGNDQPPSQAEMDADPIIRKDICRQITSSLYFFLRRKDGVDTDEKKVYKKLKYKREYEEFFLELYEGVSKHSSTQDWPKNHRYMNPYREKSVRVGGFLKDDYLSTTPRVDHVFLCLVRDRLSKAEVPYYVSKEYNVFTRQSSQHISGRFVFEAAPAGKHLVVGLLAEEPAAQVNDSLNFNIEIDYLRTRKDRKPEEFPEDDPICQIIPQTITLNQNHRICLLVLGSSFFNNEFIYVSKPHRQDPCRFRAVSFQSPQAKAEIGNMSHSYNEWMVDCVAQRADNNAETNFSVSRAYESGQMFVYRLVPPDYDAYLENRSKNMSIIDEYDDKIQQEMLSSKISKLSIPEHDYLVEQQ